MEKTVLPYIKAHLRPSQELCNTRPVEAHLILKRGTLDASPVEAHLILRVEKSDRPPVSARLIPGVVISDSPPVEAHLILKVDKLDTHPVEARLILNVERLGPHAGVNVSTVGKSRAKSLVHYDKEQSAPARSKPEPASFLEVEETDSLSMKCLPSDGKAGAQSLAQESVCNSQSCSTPM